MFFKTRRSLLKTGIGFLPLSQLLFRPFVNAKSAAPLLAGGPEVFFQKRDLKINEQRLSVLANQSASEEGRWSTLNVEGQIPAALAGKLYRVAPGQRHGYGQPLRHFFDGDAYVSQFSFSNGACDLHSRFLATEERFQEVSSQQMLFHEFGTKANGDARGFKNPPNINLLPYGENLLALSESAHPVAVNTQNLSATGRWNFSGSLAKNITFAAHPKVDPVTGDTFCYGIKQDLSLALCGFHIDGKTGQLRNIFSHRQKKAYVIHDMLLTKNHIVFVIPPLHLKLWNMIWRIPPLAEALRYDAGEPTQILIFRRDGSGEPLRLEMPSSLVFHNGNAFEEDGKIVLDTFLAKDASILSLLADYRGLVEKDFALPGLRRVEIDLHGKKISKTETLVQNCDYPSFNPMFVGSRARFLYMAQFSNSQDPLAGTSVLKYDFENRKVIETRAAPGEVLGEPVYVCHPKEEGEDAGWVLQMGFDKRRSTQSFLNIYRGEDLSLLAKVWTPHYIPLGLHGVFLASI